MTSRFAARASALFCVVLVVGLRAILPWTIAQAAARQASRHTGRLVQIEDVDLGLLRGRAAVEA